MTNPYTIITIGPIYNTFMLADKTRAFWGASNLFSGLMNKILSKLFDKNLDQNIVVPYIKNKAFLDDERHKAGLLDDRIIMKGAYADSLKETFDDAIEEVMAYIDDSLEQKSSKGDHLSSLDNTEREEAKKYFKEYFHSYIIEVDIPENENPILYISTFADSAEYQPRLGEYLGKHYIANYFDRVNRNELKKDIFTEEELAKMSKDRRFRSTAEIAASELMKIGTEAEWGQWKELFGSYQDIDDGEIYSKLRSDFGDDLKPYHKYYAIVKSDGDGFGSYLRGIGNDETKLKELSQNLFKYLKESVEYIREHGGMVVYAGGDDLLFFAPIRQNRENIFSLISALDTIFNKHFSVEKDEDYKKLSISYGVSITYYKFPLYEALDMANEQLNGVAKQVEWCNAKKKDALAVHIRKHAGQTHKLLLHKSTQAYRDFLTLINDELSTVDSSLPHRFHYELLKFEEEFQLHEKPIQTDNFFDNQFGLKERKKSAQKALTESRDILKRMQFYPNDCMTMAREKNATQVLFSMLSAVKLLRGDE